MSNLYLDIHKLDIHKCHGCGGKGWVQTWRGAERCPVCLGTGTYPPLPTLRVVWSTGTKSHVLEEDVQYV